MIDIFGDECEMKQVIRFGVKLPGYYATKSGRIFSTKTNKFLAEILDTSTGYYKTSLSFPVGIFSDHNYFQMKGKKTSYNSPIDTHRLIAETFIPIDEYPPIPIEDWNNTPESAKQFIRDAAVVDHILPDKSNNSVENLRWVTPKQNNPFRKEQELK